MHNLEVSVARARCEVISERSDRINGVRSPTIHEDHRVSDRSVPVRLIPESSIEHGARTGNERLRFDQILDTDATRSNDMRSRRD